ncbi:2-oxoadipate dehydrogenase complex component E1-like isoform X2 [Uloborus diversus]|uniref:2-oxoadipate dehydrogenase complex component E1-like isoform X2 n=1 Tax=Uloborus diversus TaxID=327109 RepID=UPI00240A5772|nr:2-oxoadipate dehydrogenase complex component E1-like isoform X2 [Uloborus diversus]
MSRFLFPNFKRFSINYHTSVGVYGFRPRPSAKVYTEEFLQNRNKNLNLFQLSEAFRIHGHKVACLNPLQSQPKLHSVQSAKLDPSVYGINLQNENQVNVEGILYSSQPDLSVQNVVQLLKQTYCSKIGVEFYHLEENEKEWFAKEFEKIQQEFSLSNAERKEIANELIKSQVFDNFLATKFTSVKRYGGEGAESMMAFFLEIFRQSCLAGLSDVMIGIPHRGRLNLLTGMLKFPPVAMFQKMMGIPEFAENTKSTGDVLSHLTSSVDLDFKGNSVHVTLLPNPSHLEAVSPVVVGYARSRLQTLKVADYVNSAEQVQYPVLPIQVHGDASFTGQGVVMETLAMANVPHFSVGGSVHLVVNNQIGFTTPADKGRSSLYCSDLIKMISSPVIHVNGDYPEEVIKAAILAFKYRQTFKKDVLVDLLCFRRWGHNELDDPTFTNPTMYSTIHSRSSVPDMYSKKLIDEGILMKEELNDMISNHQSMLSENLKLTETYKTKLSSLQRNNDPANPLKQMISKWDTGVPVDLLRYIGAKSVQFPDNFVIHPTLVKNFVPDRLKKLTKGTQIDWATAEALAIGSLLYQDCNVRISGQDVGRGTFCHRHAMLVDQKTDEIYIPLNNLSKSQSGFFEVANSILSEEGVLGFEYGFSIENTENLVIWEAQFGDFFNSAQVVFDTCISSGETKWLMQSNIVILLPHGYDGAGPEHSSCRVERFLQMSDSSEDKIDSDNVNWHIVSPTTPAQYFHLLRQQFQICKIWLQDHILKQY